MFVLIILFQKMKNIKNYKKTMNISEKIQKSPDAPLALKEAQRLKEYIESVNLYRFRNCLYDPEMYKARWTIAEFAWAFVSDPSLASMTSCYLHDILEDIKNTRNMSKLDMLKTASLYLLQYRLAEEKETKGPKKPRTLRSIAVARCVRFCTQKEFIQTIAIPDKQLRGDASLYNVIKQKVLDLFINDQWQPGFDFHKYMIAKYE